MREEDRVDDAPSRPFLAVDGPEELRGDLHQPRDLELGPLLLGAEGGRGRRGDDAGGKEGRTKGKDRMLVEEGRTKREIMLVEEGRTNKKDRMLLEDGRTKGKERKGC